MDKPGFLESEFKRLVATRDDGPADDNVVPFSESARPPPNRQERERRFHALLNALPAAVYTTDANGLVTYYNDAAAALWGNRPALGQQEWCGSHEMLSPDGMPLPHDQSPMAVAIKENRPVRGLEGATLRPDGTCVPWLAYPTPLHDEDGHLVGAVNMLVDITERKQIEEQQSLMVRELHHRVKNTLATVQAIMGSTARSAETIEEFKTALIARIGSLARTHRLLTDDGPTVSFGDILKNELDAFDDGSEGRITLTGPEVKLSSQLAVSLGMAVHELTTNAAKFGALSMYGGKIDVNWAITIEKTRRTLTFNWVESSGPEVSEPLRHGFGSRLLDFVLPGQIQAKATVDYRREGVQIHCVVPLPLEDESDTADTACDPR